MDNRLLIHQFFREMMSGGISGFAPENMMKIVDNQPEEDEDDFTAEV